jgi:chitinase
LVFFGDAVVKKNILCACALFFLAPVIALARPDRVVLGYSAMWHDSDDPVECYNYDALTHLARAFLVPHPDGSVEAPPGYFNPSMETLARRHNVKLLMSLGGEAENADNWLSIARHPQYQRRFLDDLGKLMADHGYDGVDIDWEPSPLSDDDGAAYTALLKSARTRFPRAIITTALPASEYWISHHSWPDVLSSVDYVNVMVYDYSGGWGGKAAYSSNLYPPGVYPPQPQFSVAQGMTNLVQNHQAPPAKLLMGITFWSSRFRVDHIGGDFPKNAPGFSVNITYAQTMALLASGIYRDFWDEKAAMPYLERTAGGSVVCYESPRSIQQKCQYARQSAFAGVMIWHVGADMDGAHAPLMDAVAQSFGAAAQEFPRDVLQRQIQDRRSQIDQLRAKLPGSPSGASDSAKSNSLSEAQLEDIYAQVQKRWGSLQDQLWQIEASKHGK